ncbi:MAG: NlpC/P60 family protein [Actinomycetota bacterium]|nr:NlpC/P60 family protein [Actinomycetota bacterium]MDP1877511.1 NlpC/P60 family protein [Actinomycetota bacterium]
MAKVLGTVAVLTVLVVVMPAGCLGAVGVMAGAIASSSAATVCTPVIGAQPDDTNPDTDVARADVAATITRTMRAEGWGDRGVQLAIAVAWAETRLSNATTGTGTSRGVFQQLEGYAGTDLHPDATKRWWGPWSGQRPPAGSTTADGFGPATAWGPDGWATHDRRMDVATATAMFSDATKATLTVSGTNWRTWGNRPPTASITDLIATAQAVQRFDASSTSYAAALTGPEAAQYIRFLTTALHPVALTPAPAGDPAGDLPRDGLLIFGDSLAQGYASAAPARGFGGSIQDATRVDASASDVLADPAWKTRLRDAPHRVVISLGTNGPIDDFADDARTILAALPASTHVWWPRVWGGTAATVNPALDALAATDPRLHVFDLRDIAATAPAPDGIHLTPAGYATAWTVIATALAGPDTGAVDATSTTVGCDPNALASGTAIDPASIPAPDAQAAIAVAAALTGVHSGGRYVAEGNGPIDFDCSGLTAWAWRQAGVDLVDYSYTQREATTAIPRGAVQPGDLVFWFGSDAHHVAIVTAVDGDQITIAEASNPTSGLQVRTLGGAWDDAHLSGFGRVTRAR